MGENMYVVQVEVYFTKETTVEQAEELLDIVVEECPFGLSVKNDYDGVHVRTVEFIDNLQQFSLDDFKRAFNRMVAKDLTSNKRMKTYGAYCWEMDVDDPTWSKSH